MLKSLNRRGIGPVPNLTARKHEVWERTWDLQRQQDAGTDVGEIPVPPKYATADFLKTDYWRLRRKLAVNSVLAHIRLLLDKVSDALNEGQKKNFIKNLLQEMRVDGFIHPVEGKRGSGAKWELSKAGS